MTSDSWQSRREKSILTESEIHRVTNKKSIVVPLHWGLHREILGLMCTPPLGPLPYLSHTCSQFLLYTVSDLTYIHNNAHNCTKMHTENNKVVLTFALLSSNWFCRNAAYSKLEEQIMVSNKMYLCVVWILFPHHVLSVKLSQVEGLLREWELRWVFRLEN